MRGVYLYALIGALVRVLTAIGIRVILLNIFNIPVKFVWFQLLFIYYSLCGNKLKIRPKKVTLGKFMSIEEKKEFINNSAFFVRSKVWCDEQVDIRFIRYREVEEKVKNLEYGKGLRKWLWNT